MTIEFSYNNADFSLIIERDEKAASKRKANSGSLEIDIHDNELGTFIGQWQDNCLIGFCLIDHKEKSSALNEMKLNYSKAKFYESTGKTAQLSAAMFGNERQKFNAQICATSFQADVIEALIDIPFGATSTYQLISQQIARPKAMRAVGGAIGSQPLGVIIPCHRVIGSNGQLTGYHWGLDIKTKLLEFEKNLSLSKAA